MPHSAQQGCALLLQAVEQQHLLTVGVRSVRTHLEQYPMGY
jgi:hypothetical protein